MQTFSVSEINNYIKSKLDGDPMLSGAAVRGEASNYRIYPSGHHYFSLKDSESVINCVMFRTHASKLKFKPSDGMKLTAVGNISVFPRDGKYQLYCSDLLPEGLGALTLAFEQRKEKLAALGLFDLARKKPLPRFPERIALVTSPAGAAVQDMIRVLGARWPLCEVIIVPVRVQGEEAAGEISAAIDLVNAENLADLIITGRGGGSIEDLWAFNEEEVAYALYRSRIPVISAVGHEPDVTIADFVADLRAATPSNAAELAVPDAAAWKKRLAELKDRRVLSNPTAYIDDKRVLLDFFRDKLTANVSLSIERRKTRFELSGGKLNSAVKTRLAKSRTTYAVLAGKLDAISPLKILSRGYALARKPAGGAAVRSASELTAGERIELCYADGKADCEVISINGR